MREQLLGYLLGALDPSEQAAIEARLASDADLVRQLDELRASLGPLDESAEADENDLEPPPGLGARTFQFVRNHAGWAARGQAACPAGAWRAPDYLIAAGIFIAASMLVFPAIQQSRSGARVNCCQNKLRVLGIALAQYGQVYNYLPAVPASGHFAAAGIYAPMLQQAGLISSPADVVCPESSLAKQKDFRIPTIWTLQVADPATLQQLHRVMGGSYGYHPGHIENGRYLPTRHMSREHFVVMADAADELGSDGSSNHGPRGQNVLCQSGRVVFIVIPRLVENGDHIYVNDYGVKGAGRGSNDSSVCNSAVPPIIVQIPVAQP